MKLTQQQLDCLAEFERAMREEVIPEIERVMRQRAADAAISRRWIVN